MEPDNKNKELKKLLNVLRRMARTARMNQWTGMEEAADRYSVEQYNRILSRLTQMDALAQNVFAPLPSDANWGMVSNAARDLVAFFDDESESPFPRDKTAIWANGLVVDLNAMKDGITQDVSELGQFIREKIAEWQQRKSETKAQ